MKGIYLKLPKSIVALFIIGLVIRITVVFVIGNYNSPKDWEYGEIARNIVKGDGFSREITPGKITACSTHSPLYPYILAIFYTAGNRPITFLVIELIQCLISAFTILVLYRLTAIIFNDPVAQLTALGIAIYPPFIYYCTKLVPTTIFILLIALTILFIIKMQKDNLRTSLLPGIFVGVSILCDPVAFGIYPSLVVWYLCIKKISIRQICYIFLVSFIIITPWTIRNYQVHHSLIPITTQFGINFWIGNNLNATGTDYYRVNSNEDFVLMTETLPKDILDSLNNITEVSRARYFLTKGIDFIKDNPKKFLTLIVKKFNFYWWIAPPDIYSSRDIEKYRTILILFYLPIVILGIGGIILSKNYLRMTSLIVLVIFFISAIYIFAHVGLCRYRIPLEPYLIMFSAFTLIWIIKKMAPNLLKPS